MNASPAIAAVARTTTFRLALLGTGVLGLLLVVLLAAHCPASGPAGGGVVQFGGREDASALEIHDALGINPLFTWDELEPEEGRYNWRPVDETLAAAIAKGKRVALRVYTNASDFHEATPWWVFEAGAESYYWADYSEMPQPVPTDPVFTEKFARFLEAFGERYDGHPAIELVQTNAAMGGYGEMIWGLTPAENPPGWSPDVQVETTKAWIDRWRAAFPDTPLAITVNFIGGGIGERLADYAVDRGFYLQSNAPYMSDELEDIFREHAGRTKIMLEIENNGCDDATGEDFEELAAVVFGHGVPIDYLAVCAETLRDSNALRTALAGLRK